MAAQQPRRPGREAAARITAADRAILRWFARSGTLFPEWVTPVLGEAVSNGVLWPAIAGGLWVSGDKSARRAAWRGLGSLAAARAAAGVLTGAVAGHSRTGEIPGHLVHQASRPWPLPGVRAMSIRSGAAAAAAAFATGVALEVPALAVPVSLPAATAAAAMIRADPGHRSAVIAGLAIGGISGWLTLRWWPRQPAMPAPTVRPARRAPASPTGQGLVLLVNPATGSTSPRLTRELRAELPEAKIIEYQPGADLMTSLRGAARGARIIGVAGGDAAISRAAAVALEASLPLLVIPAGAVNDFAADLGIRSPAEAIAALRAGDAVLVDAAAASKRSFVNSASTGLYLNFVRDSQRLEPALGRRLAEVAALIRVLPRGRPHELVLNGHRRRLWLSFAGNCRYEPAGLVPIYRPDLSDGYFDFRVLDAGPLARCRLIAAVVTGTLGRSRVYHAWQARSAEVSSADGAPIWLSFDGDAASAEPGFLLRKCAHCLLVYRAAD